MHLSSHFLGVLGILTVGPGQSDYFRYQDGGGTGLCLSQQGSFGLLTKLTFLLVCELSIKQQDFMLVFLLYNWKIFVLYKAGCLFYSDIVVGF